MLEARQHLEAERDEGRSLLEVLADALARVDPQPITTRAGVALGIVPEPLAVDRGLATTGWRVRAAHCRQC